MATLSGCSISSLLSSSATLNGSDLFVVSTKDVYLSAAYKSRRATAAMLSTMLGDYIRDNIHLGSMAYQLSDAYSLKTHSHDNLYNRLDVHLLYTPRKDQIVDDSNLQDATGDTEGKALSIGNLFIDGSLSTLCIPLSCVVNGGIVPWQTIEPAFGEIKFIAKDTIQRDIDYRSDNFDGWLWLNSSFEYDLNQFRLSNQIAALPDFVKSCASGKFKIKDLSTFATIDNTSSRLSCIDAYNIVPSHQHLVDFTVSGTISAYGEIPIGHSPGGGGFFHQGNGKGSIKASSIVANSRESLRQLLNDKTIKFTNGSYITSLTNANGDTWQQIEDKAGNFVITPAITVTSRCKFSSKNEISTDNSTVIATYPQHILMPALVYVGRKKGF